MTEEQVAEYQPDRFGGGRQIGAVPRSRMRAENLPHGAVGVLVRRRTGELYVHRRADTKDLWPGAHDAAAGGVILAGEVPLDAAHRELAEELGIVGAELQLLLVTWYRDGDTHYLAYVYETVWDGDITHADGEIADGWWLPEPELRRRLTDPAWPFVPDTRHLLGLLAGSAAVAVRRDLAALAEPDAERRAGKARYLQVFPGGYGEGDQVLGVSVPQVRAVVRRYRRAADLSSVRDLLDDDRHEVRLAAGLLLVELVAQARRPGDPVGLDGVAELVLDRCERLNNWDLIDSTVPGTLGVWLVGQPLSKRRQVLGELAGSTSVWRRRTAVLGTFGLIRAGLPEETLRLAVVLIDDPHSLVHKAVGWLLREVGARDPEALDAFLDSYAGRLSRVCLRAALERQPPDRRDWYLSARNRAAG